MASLADAPQATPLARTRERLAWLTISSEALVRAGEPVDLERLVAHWPAAQAAARDLVAALFAAAGDAGQPELVTALWGECGTDPLLRYLLAAEPAAPDETLLTWLPDIQSFSMTVIDAWKARRFQDEGDLMRHLFRCETDDQLFQKVARGAMPSLRRLEKSGAVMLSSYATLALRDGRIGEAAIAAPREHRGRPLGPTVADALQAAIATFTTEAERVAAILLDGAARR